MDTKHFSLRITLEEHELLWEHQSLTIPRQGGVEGHLGEVIELICDGRDSIAATPISSTKKPGFEGYVTLQPLSDAHFNT